MIRINGKLGEIYVSLAVRAATEGHSGAVNTKSANLVAPLLHGILHAESKGGLYNANLQERSTAFGPFHFISLWKDVPKHRAKIDALVDSSLPVFNDLVNALVTDDKSTFKLRRSDVDEVLDMSRAEQAKFVRLRQSGGPTQPDFVETWPLHFDSLPTLFAHAVVAAYFVGLALVRIDRAYPDATKSQIWILTYVFWNGGWGVFDSALNNIPFDRISADKDLINSRDLPTPHQAAYTRAATYAGNRDNLLFFANAVRNEFYPTKVDSQSIRDVADALPPAESIESAMTWMEIDEVDSRALLFLHLRGRKGAKS